MTCSSLLCPFPPILNAAGIFSAFSLFIQNHSFAAANESLKLCLAGSHLQ